MTSEKGKSSARVCIVGAGPCGLTTIKNLKAAGISNIVCYDDGDAIGGNWVFDERSNRPSVHDTTHLISSKTLSEFEDYPFPDDFPDFPSHRQMRTYFGNYARHFGLLAFIRLNTHVSAARLLPDQRWSVTATDSNGEREEVFDYLIVCSGHHREPLMPSEYGVFAGQTLHSSQYKRPDVFSEKRVLVVGGGNSACDIAVDIGRVARNSWISMRRGYHIIPKLMYGRPTDVMYARLRKWLRFLPRPALQSLVGALVKLLVGRPESYGLKKPDRAVFKMHPTLSSDILGALRNGRVLPRAGIRVIEGCRVQFQDGTSEEFDVVIWATGFHFRFPFLDDSVFVWNGHGPVPLYLKMMHKRIPNIFFIGLFQPIGCIWRLADYQARIAALQINGDRKRPRDIETRIDKEVSSRHWDFVKTTRHAVAVDYHDFRAELLKELNCTP